MPKHCLVHPTQLISALLGLISIEHFERIAVLSLLWGFSGVPKVHGILDFRSAAKNIAKSQQLLG